MPLLQQKTTPQQPDVPRVRGTTGGIGWRTFNDRLALVLMVLIPALWASKRWLDIPGEALGATIAVWTLIAQFYFRKKQP